LVEGWVGGVGGWAVWAAGDIDIETLIIVGPRRQFR